MTEPLTSKERGQWFLHQVADNKGLCNLAVSCQFDRPLRWWPAQEAVRLLVARHSVLRQNFPATAGTPARRIGQVADRAATLEVTGGTEEDLDSLLAELTAKPFDLAADLLIRFTHVMLGGGSVLLIVAHHLVVDGRSMTILMEEFCRLYQRLAEGEPVTDVMAAPLPRLREPAADLEAVRRWAERLPDTDASHMTLDGARPLAGSPAFTCDWVTVELPDEARALVSGLRTAMRVSDGILALAVSAALLHRHGAGAELIIGLPVDLRRGAAEADTVGFHVSTVPVAFHFPEGTSFREVVAQARETVVDILSAAPVSFEQVLEHLGHRSADWRTPLFRHVVNPFQPKPASDLPGVRDLRLHRAGCRVDLELLPQLRKAGSCVQAWFSTEVHDRDDVTAMLRRFAPLLAAVARTPDAPVAELDIFSQQDRVAIERANATTRPLPSQTLAGLALADHSDRTAVVDGQRSWSYRELGQAVAYAADQLGRQGVGPGDRVAVVGARGVRLAVAVLAVWTRAAAYVPIDPALPAGRAAEMTRGCTGVVVPQGSWTVMDGHPEKPPVLPVELAETGAGLPWPTVAASLDDPAVVIFTSGSTGQPKGVIVSHRAMTNVMTDFATRLDVKPDDRMLWLSAFSFDVSALELFVPLISGAAVVVADDGARDDPRALLARIVTERVGLAQATPTMWRELLPLVSGELTGVRAISGGEPLTAALAERLLATGCRLINAYGPTETTIWSTVAEVSLPVASPVTVGRPIANTIVEIRDARGEPCPPGLLGEVWIGGAGLAHGYIGRPDLTADRFVTREGTRWYRTGDLARWRPDGSLVLHGRTDRQVKLRGHRIELGEVEAVLEQHAGVRAAAARLVPGPAGDELLAAFVQPSGGYRDADALTQSLWPHLRERLPSYEIPSRIVAVPAFPQTTSGKVDQHGLLALLPALPTVPAEADDDPLVEQLTMAWRETLANPGLGPDANFFLSGGHSLLAVRLLARLDPVTGRPVDYGMLFAAPTPAALAARLRAEGTKGRPCSPS